MKTQIDPVLRGTLLAAVLALSACASMQASTTLESKSGSTVIGNATFSEDGDQVTLQLDVTGASPGAHGAHIHELGDCSAADASSAGGHWNPTTKVHGTPNPEHHLGDLGNIQIGQDGKGTLKLSKEEWTLGDGASTDVVGKALVIHAGEDDLQTDPAGASGARQACGVISKQ
ncbi:superoxide dismutase family protein [Archangium violaceum]|uniref:superoxide dismutase family protein n=1 Tax=Archangium violaceum TaxID=83451 RepID=UPI00194ECD02|nr:superoxide dismutase family protein [Archangium violaceum]QRO02056.1 superoxide dismutase family protein [Archangium violaceum]